MSSRLFFFSSCPARSPRTRPQNTQKFDAADVSLRLKTGTTGQPNITGGVYRGGRYDLRNATMVDLIATAYSINDSELIVGGPAWLERNRFDIAAKAPQTTSPANVKLMLQTLLADNFGFKLALHKDTRPMAGFVLTLGKDKHKLKEASGPGNGCQGSPPPQPPPPVPVNRGTCRGVTLDEFAALLRNIGNGDINSPVVFLTGLQGYWDFDVAFTPFQALQRAFRRHHHPRVHRKGPWPQARTGPGADGGLHRRQRERGADVDSVWRLRVHSVAAPDGVRRGRGEAEPA